MRWRRSIVQDAQPMSPSLVMRDPYVLDFLGLRDIVDPDIPADRERIGADLDIIAALATLYIKADVGVPDEMDL